MTRKRLRHGLVWFNKNTPLNVDGDWPNQGRQLRPFPAAAGSASSFTADTGAVFTSAANEAWDVGDDDALDVNLTSGLSALVRFNITSSSDDNTGLIGKYSFINDLGWAIIGKEGGAAEIGAMVSNGTTDHLVTVAAAHDTWHTAGLTWDGPNSTTTLYLDGVAQGSDTTTIGTSPAATTRNCWIGRQGTSEGNQPDGTISDVAIFRQTLSAADMLLLSNDMTYGVDELMIDRIWVDCPDGVSWAGNNLQFTTSFHGATLSGATPTLEDAEALAAQFKGLRGAVPIWSSSMPNMNGQYQVLGDVSVVPGEAYLATESAPANGQIVHVAYVSMNVRRLTSDHHRAEQTQKRAVRTSSGLTITTSDARTRTALAGEPDFATIPPTYLSALNTETGPVQQHNETLASANLEDDARYDLHTIDALNGAATIEDITDTAFPVTGDVLHADRPSNVRLSNGLARFWITDDSELTAQRWSADGGWGATHIIELTLGGNAVTFPEITPRVTVNTHLEVGLVYPIATSAETGWELAIRLRRAPTIVAEIELSGANTAALDVSMDSGAQSLAIQATPYEGCIRSYSADADSLYGHLLGAEAEGTAETDGTMDQVTATSHVIGFGIGGATTGPAQDFFCAESFTEWVRR